MASTLHVYVETDGERHGGSSIEVPDIPPDRGQGSRLRAERLAAVAIGAAMQLLDGDRDLPGG
jgi:hypothetical protein